MPVNRGLLPDEMIRALLYDINLLVPEPMIKTLSGIISLYNIL